jgi:hypothetical protein
MRYFLLLLLCTAVLTNANYRSNKNIVARQRAQMRSAKDRETKKINSDDSKKTFSIINVPGDEQCVNGGGYCVSNLPLQCFGDVAKTKGLCAGDRVCCSPKKCLTSRRYGICRPAGNCHEEGEQAVSGICGPDTTDFECCLHPVFDVPTDTGKTIEAQGCGVFIGSNILSYIGNSGPIEVVKIHREFLVDQTLYDKDPTEADITLSVGAACAFGSLARSADLQGMSSPIVVPTPPPPPPTEPHPDVPPSPPPPPPVEPPAPPPPPPVVEPPAPPPPPPVVEPPPPPPPVVEPPAPPPPPPVEEPAPTTTTTEPPAPPPPPPVEEPAPTTETTPTPTETTPTETTTSPPPPPPPTVETPPAEQPTTFIEISAEPTPTETTPPVESKSLQLKIVRGFNTLIHQDFLWSCYETKTCPPGTPTTKPDEPGFSIFGSGNVIEITATAEGLKWVADNIGYYGFRKTNYPNVYQWFP